MNDRRLLSEMKQVVLENVGEELVSLYVIGSFLTKEMVESSDIDLVGVMKPTFDFRKAPRINKALNRRIRRGHTLDLGTLGYDEFFGAAPKGSLAKHIELPVFLNFLKRARLIYGKRIDFDKLPIKPASPEEELRYHIKVFDEYEAAFRKSNRIRSDFSFKDFLKIVFYIANLELQLTRSMTPTSSYSEIVKALRNDNGHIVHHSMKLRHMRTVRRKERQVWLDAAQRYVAEMRALFPKK